MKRDWAAIFTSNISNFRPRSKFPTPSAIYCYPRITLTQRRCPGCRCIRWHLVLFLN